MALIINLHGPNTNTLGNLIAGALTEMGYSASAIPSCRRKMELEALHGDERAIRLTDGSLESCVELAAIQADLNRHSIDTEQDAVIVCGPVVDSFWGYKGDRTDSFYRAAIETAVDLASPEWHELARAAKDAAAGAVLLASAGSVIVGLIVFAPYVIDLL